MRRGSRGEGGGRATGVTRPRFQGILFALQYKRMQKNSRDLVSARVSSKMSSSVLPKLDMLSPLTPDVEGRIAW
jgi:hypothetical protein